MIDQIRTTDEQNNELELLRAELKSLNHSHQIALTALQDKIKNLSFNLTERKKELRCHNKISMIMANPDLTKNQVINQIVEIIPEAWQFPDLTMVSVQIGDLNFQSPGFEPSVYMMSQDITAYGTSFGKIEIAYNGSFKPGIDYSFLNEETDLLFSIAVRIGTYLVKDEKDEALQKSESLYRSVLQASPDGISITDLEGKILFLSPQSNKMFNLEKGDIAIGRSLLEFIDPEDHEKAIFGITNMLQGNLLGAAEYRGLKTDGTIFDIEVNGEFIRSEEGKPVNMLFVTRDISDRKMAERKLVRSEELFRNMVENINDVVYEISISGFIKYVSPSIEKFLGFKPEEIIGKSFFEFMHEEDKPVILERLSNLHRKDYLFLEYRYYGKDGSIHWVRSSTNPVFEEGQVIGGRGVLIDITERKFAEEKLRQSEEKYRSLINSLDAAIILIDKDGKILYMNDIAARPFNIGSVEAVGLPVTTILPAEEANGIYSDVLKVIESNQGHNSEIEVERIDGKHWYRVSIQPVRSDKGVPDSAILYINDTTEIKKKEILIRQNEIKYEEKLRKLSVAVEQCPVSIVITNLEGEIEYANPKACETTGYGIEELVGQNPRVLKSGETTLDEYNLLWENIAHGKEWKGIFHNKRKSGELYWESSTIGPITDNLGNITHYLAVKEDITERRQIQMALYQSEERFRQIAEVSQTMIFETNAKGVYTYVSPIASHILGIDPELIVGKWNYYDSLPEEYRDSAIATYNNQLPVNQLVYPFQRFDCSIIWVEINAVPFFDENNQFFGYRGGLTDITKRKLAEEEMQKFRTVADQSNYGSAIADMNGILIYVNNAFARMHGWNSEDLSGKHLSIFHNEEQIIHVAQLLKQVQISGGFPAEEVWHIHKDGHPFPTLMSVVTICDENKVPLFLSASLLDITELKIKEQEIRKLNQAIKQSPVSIVVTDLDGNIEYVSPAFFQTTGYTPNEVIGRNTSILKSGKTDPQVYVNLWQTIGRGKPWQGEWINKKKDGEFYWESVSITPILNDKGQLINYLAVKQDITERKKTEKTILELNANLEVKIMERTAELQNANNQLISEIEERKQMGAALLAKTIELETFFNVSLDLMCISDFSGKFIRVNQAWESVMGYAISDLVDRYYPDFIHPEDLQNTFEALGSLDKQHPDFTLTHRFKAKNESYRLIEWNGAVSGSYIYAAARDITESRRAEEFEYEMLQLSPKLTGISISEINSAIYLALNRIGQLLGAANVSIYEFDFILGNAVKTHEWGMDSMTSKARVQQVIACSDFPQTYQALLDHKNILVTSIHESPEHLQKEIEFLVSDAGLTLILIPMLVDEEVIGFVGLNGVPIRNDSNFKEVNILKVWSSMMASLINNQRKEDLFEQTRRNYEIFFNTIDDFIFVLDKQGNITHCNSAVTNRLGYKMEELAGKSVILVRPPERREEAEQTMVKLLSGEMQICSIPLMTKTGIQIPVETKVKEGFWNGQPVAFAVSKDISQVKLSEQKFASAFHVSSAMMAISRFEKADYIDINNAFLETMGYTRDEIIGHTNAELGLFLDISLRDKIVKNVNNSEPVRKWEIEMRTRSGEVRTGLVSADSIYIGDERCLLTVNVDITERKKAEDELRKARIEADRANLAKSEFLSRMSHELRTPMNSILGFAQLLEMGQLNLSQRKGVSHIIKSGKHLLDLINEVLDISRIESGRITLSIEPVQLGAVIAEMVDIVKPLSLAGNISIEMLNLPDSRLFVKTDRQRLKQILINLLNNAIKYNRQGGMVRLNTEIFERGINHLRAVRISISDTGLGISEKDLPNIFNPFERIGAERTQIEGTGLGLAVVKKLTEAMGGTLGVESVIHSGSTFWIELPGCEGPLESLAKSGC